MKSRLPVVLLGCLLSTGASAEVLETTPNSFVVESSVVVAAAPDAAYAALTRSIADWWNPEHTWSGNSANLSLDARAGGCFCERFQPPADDGSVQHGQVIFARSGKLLRLNAALGPFQEMAIQGVLTFRFKAEDKATRVTVNYRVSGAMTLEPSKLAPMADAMLAGQMQRFRLFIETGKATK